MDPEQARYQAELLDCAPWPAAVLDHDGRILHLNGALALHLGTTPDSALGQPLGHYLEDQDRPRLLELLGHAAANDPSPSLDVRTHRAADGRERRLRLLCRPGRTAGEILLHGRDVTEELRRNRRRDQDLERMSDALDAAMTGLWEVDLASGEVRLDPRASTLLGLATAPRSMTIGDWRELVHPDDEDQATAVFTGDDAKERSISVEVRAQHRDGRWIWISLSGRIVDADAAHGARRLAGTLRDVTGRRSAQDQARRLGRRLELATRAAGFGTFEMTLANRRLQWDERMFSLFELPPNDDRPLQIRWRDRLVDEDRERVLQELRHVLRTGESAEITYRVALSDHAIRWIRASVTCSLDAAGRRESLLGVCLDVTREKEDAANLRRLALTDPLTGLHNRRAFAEALERAHQRRTRAPSALLCLDVDHFKRINDTWGHPAGDVVLIEIATRLRATARSSDLIARIGGEEFAILMDDTTASTARAVAQRIADAIRSTPISHDPPLEITASMGLVETRADDIDADAPLRRVDRALYTAKQTGRDRIVIGDEAEAHAEH